MQTQIILNLLILIIGAFMTATFTHLLHWCFGSPNEFEAKEGRIFSLYGKWLYDKYAKTEIRSHGKGLNWYKVLGMCIYCFAVYISFISLALGFMINWYHLNSQTQPGKIVEIFVLIIIYPAVSNFFLRKIK